jgi:hypothetical protein
VLAIEPAELLSRVAVTLGDSPRVVEKHYNQPERHFYQSTDSWHERISEAVKGTWSPWAHNSPVARKCAGGRYKLVWPSIAPIEFPLYIAIKPQQEHSGECNVEGDAVYCIAEVGNFMHATSLDEPKSGRPRVSLFRRGDPHSSLSKRRTCYRQAENSMIPSEITSEK